MQKNFILFLLVTAHFCVLFNSIFSNFGFNYLYLLPFFTVIFVLLINGVFVERFANFSPAVFYLLTVLVLTIIHINLYQSGFDAVMALGLYASPVVIWFLFFCKYTKNDFLEIFNITYLISVSVALLGIVQYFFSPELFGLIPAASKSIEWAADDDFSVYSTFFRATSTLGSPQVFGLFCAFYVVLSDLYNNYFPRFITLFGFIIFFIAGALSGNKLFFVIVMIYFFFVYFIHTRGLFFPKAIIVFFAGFILFFANVITESLPMLERVLDVESYAQQEKSDSRIDKYLYILNNTDVFLGNGLGSITNKSTLNLKAAESYILKLFYEGGFFLASFFLGMFFILIASVRSLKEFYFVLLIFFSLIVVHAFESPSFFIIWGFLFSNVNSFKEHLLSNERF